MSRLLLNIRRQSESVFDRKCMSSSFSASRKKDLDGPFPAAYNPSNVETGWYAWWVSEGLFDSIKQPSAGKLIKKFTMVLPPPNVTGDLHVGHALAVTIEDVLQRWHRSSGYSCHWVPGFDHAGIATQVVVEKKIKAESAALVDRHQMGRRAFVREVLEWSDEKKRVIRRQLQSLGASLDWTSEVFTMDEGFSTAVTEAFVRLHEAGLVQRRRTLVNWCCQLRSTISDMEVEHVIVGGQSKKTYKDPSFNVPIAGKLYRFAYKLADQDGRAGTGNNEVEVVVATTRPETMLGDVAVAVNPDDPRFVRFAGRRVVHPFDGRLLPVIRDGHVNPAFGTGAMKVTPGHSHEDFSLAERHDLPLITVLDEKGQVAKADVPQFDGLNRFAARTAVVRQLDRLGLFRGEEDHEVTLPVCSRSGGVVEPLLKSQWFLETSQLMGEIAKDLEEGNLVISPEHALKDLRHWLSISKDAKWCLSRQLWWGHQIPAYRPAALVDEDSWIVARSPEAAAEKCNGATVDELMQDEDVLDTWFSSALFPFAVHGWPENTESLRTHYPLGLMETGRDILFFWVVRMLMLGKRLTGDLPFTKVLAHGLVCDAHGRKMSKSLGNVVDPTHIIHGVSLNCLQKRNEDHRRDGYISAEELEKAQAGLAKNFPDGIPECGADALRFALCSQDVQDQTVSIDVKFVHSCKLFCNKIWQASRFYLMSKNKATVMTVSETRANMSPLDLWILSQLANMVVECDNHLNAYDFHLATWALKKFWYFQLCDVYVEGIKPVLDQNGSSSVEQFQACLSVLEVCIRTGLVALSPFMPFLAEELYQRLKLGNRSVCQAPYPAPDEWKHWRDPRLDNAFEVLSDVVSELRSFKQLFNVPNKAKPNVHLMMKQYFRSNEMNSFVETLGRCHVVNYDRADVDGMLSLKRTPQYELYVELSNGSVGFDVEKSLTNLEQRTKKLSKQLKHKLGDDIQANILREEKQKIENHLNYLRTLAMK